MPLPRVVAQNLVTVRVRRPARRPRRRAARAAAAPAGFVAFDEVAAAAAPPLAADVPGLVVEGQLQSEWCWAAVGQAVARLDGKPSAAGTQCQFAGRVLNAACCPAAQACNRPLSFRFVLGRAGYQLAAHQFVGRLRFRDDPNGRDIMTQVAAGRPIPVAIQWTNRPSGHVIVLCGYEVDADGTEFVYLFDPLLGPTGQPVPALYIDYAVFSRPGGYAHGGGAGAPVGTWTFSYLPTP